MLTKDFSIAFCGVKLPNPFHLPSSSTGSCYEIHVKTYDTGWGSVVFRTIGFFIANEVSSRLDHLVKKGTGFIGFRDMEQIAGYLLEENLAVLRRLKEDYPGKALIASIMGKNEQQWEELTCLVQEAGADMIECNFSCPQMTSYAMGNDVGQSPELVEKYCRAVKCGSTLPMLTKVTPNVGDMCEVALVAKCDGADGIVAINIVKSITNIDLNQKVGMPVINGRPSISGYSGKAVRPIVLYFIQQMCIHPELRDFPTNGIGGIETWEDAAKLSLLNAAALQVTTDIMQYGYRIVEGMASGLSYYLTGRGFDSLQEMIGLADHNIVPAENLDRSYIVYPHVNLGKCVGCGRCYIPCYDDGYQTMEWGEKTRTPHCDTEKCVGCLFCGHVCLVGCTDLGEVKSRKGEEEHPITLQSPSHFRHLVPVAGCGLSALPGLQSHTNQYVVPIIGRIKCASVASGIWFLLPDTA